MIAELILSMAMLGQCYGPSYTTQRVVVAPAEHQILSNHGSVYSKCYVPIRLSDGYSTSIPIINGIVPVIKSSPTSDGGRRLVLDYGQGCKYSNIDSCGGPICYSSRAAATLTEPSPEPVSAPIAAPQALPLVDPPPDSESSLAPVPLPEPPGYFSERMDALEGKVDVLIDKVNEEDKDPAIEELRKLIEELRQEQQRPQVEPIKEVPPAQSPTEPVQSPGDGDQPALKSPLMGIDDEGDPQSSLVEPWMRPSSPYAGTVPGLQQ